MPVKPKIDLRALEANALKVVNKSKYKKVTKRVVSKTLSNMDKIKTQYARSLAVEIGKYRRQEITYTKFLNNVKYVMSSSYEKAYLLGKGGKLTATDRVWLKFEVRDELFYWKRFMAVIKKFFFKADDSGAELPTDLPSMLRRELKNIKWHHYRRFNMYVDALDAVYTQAKVTSLPDHVMINWVYGEAEHCPECIYLEKMSPYVKETLPTVPRAGKTRCLTHCKCVLVYSKIDERQYHILKDYSSRRTTHVKRLMKTRSLSPAQASKHIKLKYKP